MFTNKEKFNALSGHEKKLLFRYAGYPDSLIAHKYTTVLLDIQEIKHKIKKLWFFQVSELRVLKSDLKELESELSDLSLIKLKRGI
jgi:hypothetical protein